MIRLLIVGVVITLLQGCARDVLTPLASRPMNTWLLGIWEYKDSKGNLYRAGVYPLDTTHYSIDMLHVSGPDRSFKERQFKAYISRVDQMTFLDLLPVELRRGQARGSIIVHYQLQSPIEVVITPVNLEVSGAAWSWKLRQKVRILKKAGTLFPPNTSMLWQKVREVYWQKNASLAVQPGQPLRLPLYDPTVPSQNQALDVGPSRGFNRQ